MLQIVATAEGYGPAASDMIDVRKGRPVELRVAEDNAPIEGSIRTLEGEPVAGATIRVAILECSGDVDKRIEFLRQQTKREKPGQMMLNSFAIKDFLAPGFDQNANERGVANKLHHSRFTSKSVTTDQNGRFRLTGVGRDRLLALELSGPGIVRSWISVITRDIEPINAALFIGGRTRITYGANFTYSAEPSQPIIGTITDMETGKPIEGVRVGSSAAMSSSAHVAAVTNSNGTYRLEGLPKSKRYHLNITPPRNAPYFPRQYVEVTKVGTGLEATIADFKLRRTKWYSGRIVNKITGKPVAARIVYSPRIDNKQAENYAAFVKGRFSADSFESDGNSVATDPDGKFRTRVISGHGMLFVRCNEPNFSTGFGRELLTSNAKWWGFEENRMTNTYQPMFPEWVHRLWPIQISDSEERLTHDITVDPGQTLNVRMVDPQGKSLSGRDGRRPNLTRL